jgi:hypothetical protein
MLWTAPGRCGLGTASNQGGEHRAERRLASRPVDPAWRSSFIWAGPSIRLRTTSASRSTRKEQEHPGGIKTVQEVSDLR